jgi:hypothetical protein
MPFFREFIDGSYGSVLSKIKHELDRDEESETVFRDDSFVRKFKTGERQWFVRFKAFSLIPNVELEGVDVNDLAFNLFCEKDGMRFRVHMDAFKWIKPSLVPSVRRI